MLLRFKWPAIEELQTWSTSHAHIVNHAYFVVTNEIHMMRDKYFTTCKLSNYENVELWFISSLIFFMNYECEIFVMNYHDSHK